MAASKLNRFWTLMVIFLLAITIVGGIVAWSRYSPEQAVEISLPSAEARPGRIYLGGAVTNPGFYLFTTSDSLESLLRAAGGPTSSANISELQLYIAGAGAEQGSQKININRAEVWLLEALPGIGPTLSQRIVDYRQHNGPFRNTGELLKVAGIGTAIYEPIKHLITVADESPGTN
ncbi:MAG: helix-hairpin-helix domain-containing protein [Dehalococcoidales bacterium]|nr:helix-hairpin-helix domain-containing protein [Dehalococcoidales bacterium]